MTKQEAVVLVATLVNAYPSAKFTVENAELYERGIMDLGARETQDAIEELIRSAQFLPSVAAIRSEVVRARRDRVARQETEARRRLLGETGARLGPYPAQWGPVLARMLEAGARHRAMAEKWYRERGKKPPPDPASEFQAICESGARGDDVRERVAHATGVGDFEEQERRYP